VSSLDVSLGPRCRCVRGGTCRREMPGEVRLVAIPGCDRLGRANYFFPNPWDGGFPSPALGTAPLDSEVQAIVAAMWSRKGFPAFLLKRRGKRIDSSDWVDGTRWMTDPDRPAFMEAFLAKYPRVAERLNRFVQGACGGAFVVRWRLALGTWPPLSLFARAR